MKKVLLLFIFALFAIGITACGESTISKVDPSEESEKENSGVEVFSIGDTVNVDGLNVTLNSVRVSTGDEWLKPEFGKYVILDLSFENTTDQAKNVSTMLQMSLSDDQGYSHGIALYTGTKGSVDGEVGPGRTVRGEVAFDVGDSSFYEFIFEDPFLTGQAIWKFSLE